MNGNSFIEEVNTFSACVIGNIFSIKSDVDRYYQEGCKALDMQKILLTDYRHLQYSDTYLQACKSLYSVISILANRIEDITEQKYECGSDTYKNYMNQAIILCENFNTDFLESKNIESLQESLQRKRIKFNLIFNNEPCLMVSSATSRVKIGEPYTIVYTFNRPTRFPISIKANGFTIKKIGTPKIDIENKETTYTCQFVFLSYDTFKVPIATIDYFGEIFSSPELNVNLKSPKKEETPNTTKTDNKTTKIWNEYKGLVIAIVMFLLATIVLLIDNMLESWLAFGSSIAFLISRILSLIHSKFPYQACPTETEAISMKTINGCGIMEFPIGFNRKPDFKKEQISMFAQNVSYVFISVLYLPLIPIGCYSIMTLWSSKIYKGSKQGVKFLGMDKMHFSEIIQIYLTCYSLVLYVPTLCWLIYYLISS